MDYNPPPEQPRTPPPQPRQRPGMTIFQSFVLSGCVSLLAPVLLFLALFALGYVALSYGFKQSQTALESFSGGSSAVSVREQVLRPGAAGAGTIAIVKIHGAIMGDGSPLDGTGSMSQIADELRAASEDDAVKAVILQIDSPGGGLAASDLLHNEVLTLRARGKPVIAWAAGTMASGGYYIAVAAEKIYASPTATIGSIGVIMRHFQVEELLRKLGIRVNPLVSGDHKDLGSPFREMTAEEREILQSVISSAHERFVTVVAEGRGMPPDQVRPLADGSVFTAQSAQAVGMIDGVGYLDDAITRMEEMVGQGSMRIVSYRRAPGLLDIFREAGKGVSAGLVQSAAENPAPGPMAVWDGQ